MSSSFQSPRYERITAANIAIILTMTGCTSCVILAYGWIHLDGASPLPFQLAGCALLASLIAAFYMCRKLHVQHAAQSRLKITDRRNAEDVLHARERQLRLIIETIPALLWTASPDGEANYLNRRITEYTGRTLNDFVLLGWTRLIHPDDLEVTATAWTHSIDTGCTYEVTHRLRRADGEYRWFHVVGESIRDENGHIVCWYVIHVDINARKMAERAQAESERELRITIDSIPGMICVTSGDGDIEYVNKPMLDLIDVGLDSVQNSGWTKTIHPEDAAILEGRFRAAVAARVTLDTEYRRLCPDGLYRWFHVRMKPFINDDQTITRWYALITDVDDRMNAQDALVRTENQLRLIIDTMPALAWCATPAGEPSYVNQRLIDYTGLTLEDHRQLGWSVVVHPDDVDLATRVWKHAVAIGESYRVTVRIRGADGVYRWFQERADPLRDKDGNIACWYGLRWDVDDSKKMEDTLRYAQARLSRAAQVTTVGELSASIAHEISQPLAAVVANGHACLKFLSEPINLERARLTAQNIVQDGNSAADVVQRIRALFKNAPPNKAVLDINEVIIEILRLMGDEVIAKAIEVKTDLDLSIPRVSADRIQIQQLVSNLVHNAIDSMEELPGGPRQLFLSSRTLDTETVVIQICDSGRGIQDIERIFEPFFTTKEKGMGVGLSICRSIIEAHRGRLWVAANEGPGTSFFFSLPM